MRNDSVSYAHIKVQLDCLIWGRKPSVTILQIIYIIDFQTSLKETGIYHSNCGRRECVSLPFYQDNGKWHRSFFCLLPDFFQFTHTTTFPFETKLRKMPMRLPGPRIGGNFACLFISPRVSHQQPATLHSALRDSTQG